MKRKDFVDEQSQFVVRHLQVKLNNLTRFIAQINLADFYLTEQLKRTFPEDTSHKEEVSLCVIYRQSPVKNQPVKQQSR